MLQPLRGKLLVEVLPNINKTESGLFLTPKEEVPHRGRVIEIGTLFIDKKGKEWPWGISKGHIVHFKRIWDQKKVTHYIIKREQIFAVEHEGRAYGFSDQVIVKKSVPPLSGIIFVPSYYEMEVAKQQEYGIVISVGSNNRQGINVGDEVMYFKNEGLKVQMPLQEELISLKPRAIFAKLKENV